MFPKSFLFAEKLEWYLEAAAQVGAETHVRHCDSSDSEMKAKVTSE